MSKRKQKVRTWQGGYGLWWAWVRLPDGREGEGAGGTSERYAVVNAQRDARRKPL